MPAITSSLLGSVRPGIQTIISRLVFRSNHEDRAVQSRLSHPGAPKQIELATSSTGTGLTVAKAQPRALQSGREHDQDESRADRHPAGEDQAHPRDQATTLADLDPGERAVVARVLGRRVLRRRLVDLGLTSGAEVMVKRVAPLGDPMEVLVKGTHLSLRGQEAATIEIEIQT